MPIVVQKYGGSSVADITKLKNVADQVVSAKRDGNDVVVVVSAMGKTTDNLLSLAREACGEGAEPPKRELDMLLSTGERVSMALLSIAIQSRGYDAVSFTGSQSGIITNDRHFDARIIEVRPHRIEDELARGRIVIVAGYQGMSYKREITTLGRGGSDTTAVALAAALGAERCEIYSDVDGVYSADPRVVPDAVHIPRLDYATMQEMAEAGAKVLNAQAVEWARRNKVAIIARKTGNALGRETIVLDEQNSALERAVVTQKNIALLRAPSEAAAQLLSAAASAALPLGDISVAARELVAWAPLANVPNFSEVCAALRKRVSGLTIADSFGVLSLVGVEVGTRAEVLSHALELLPEPAEAIFSHPLRISCLIREASLERAAKSWHSDFASGKSQAATTSPAPPHASAALSA